MELLVGELTHPLSKIQPLISYPKCNTQTQQDTDMSENNEQQDVIVKEVYIKAFYSTADIADVFEVSQSRIRQVRNLKEVNVNPTEFAGAKMHTQADFEKIAEYIQKYSNIRVKFITEHA